LVILDPWEEIQYVDVASWWEYRRNSGAAYGCFSPHDTGDLAILGTYLSTERGASLIGDRRWRNVMRGEEGRG